VISPWAVTQPTTSSLCRTRCLIHKRRMKKQRRQQYRAQKPGEVCTYFLYSIALCPYWPTGSDILARIPAKTIDRKSGPSNSAGNLGLRATCTTLSTLADAFPTATALLDIPQPPRLQDRQCWHHCCIQRRIHIAGQPEETWLSEHVRYSRHHKGSDDGVGVGQRCGRRAGLYFR
jgi:hypothetical protein